MFENVCRILMIGDGRDMAGRYRRGAPGGILLDSEEKEPDRNRIMVYGGLQLPFWLRRGSVFCCVATIVLIL